MEVARWMAMESRKLKMPLEKPISGQGTHKNVEVLPIVRAMSQNAIGQGQVKV